MTNEEYGRYVDALAPRSKTGKNLLNAFWVGGLICAIGQALLNGYQALGLDETTAGAAVSISLVLLSAILTGFAVYDDIAKFAGAGTLVPITGFANAVVAPAIEFQTEGFVLGTAAKMFTIAGPVIVYGLSASVLYGVIYWVCSAIEKLPEWGAALPDSYISFCGGRQRPPHFSGVSPVPYAYSVLNAQRRGSGT